MTTARIAKLWSIVSICSLAAIRYRFCRMAYAKRHREWPIGARRYGNKLARMVGDGPDQNAEIARLLAQRADKPACDADAISEWQWRRDGWSVAQPPSVRLPEARATRGEDDTKD